MKNQLFRDISVHKNLVSCNIMGEIKILSSFDVSLKDKLGSKLQKPGL